MWSIFPRETGLSEHQGRETWPAASLVLAGVCLPTRRKEGCFCGQLFRWRFLHISNLFILESCTNIYYLNIYLKDVNIYLKVCLLLYFTYLNTINEYFYLFTSLRHLIERSEQTLWSDEVAGWFCGGIWWAIGSDLGQESSRSSRSSCHPEVGRSGCSCRGEHLQA